MKKQGRVIQSTGKWYKVSTGDGVVDCRLPGRFRLETKDVTNPVAVGDRVTVQIESDDTGMITEIMERENYIPRQATHGRRGEQILAANIDRAWVVQSVKKPKLKQGFIDRFLIACEAYEVSAGIIINKMDLAGKKEILLADEIEKIYTPLGYPVFTTSAKQPDMLKDWLQQLPGVTSVLIGPSGTGKTSLLNAIDSDLNLKTGDVSGYSNKGKHTTTFASLIPLEQDGYVVDTPGIREFGLVDIGKAELSLYFPEMAEPRQNCKYYNCTHFHEPDCGVVEAWQKGNIDPGRYQSYLNILESLD